METSFLELRCKEVVNVVDGKRLGHIIDVAFNLATGCVTGIIVPGGKSFWNVFKNGSEFFIPLNQIVKIGEDTILVQIYGGQPTGNPYILSSPNNKN